jgi:predicted flavoprotein YhiN
MEAGKAPDLYAIGDAVDVTGWLGGYNFQWAWASGVAAEEAVRGKDCRDPRHAAWLPIGL